ncbi:MAG: 6,7-dimethyl-8-ribityllumazine synthase [Candidatus Omnitrophica bacterium]|nr:6,7-dimethyl-8-ribityllumazine synthase [Candidatus Omnitrophota bacterium]MCM8809276.1 6,7-dimethyl-8-ribityllumazine synthase [Candidatus Omnitrophota bacterium]MCM8810869.1 6,7-dimethyl-8-ribityllumazine synthase [Candidatus Omnitrophota bacterium]
MRIIEGYLDAKGKKFCIIVSRFNDFITKRLLEGAIDCLKRHNAEEENIDIVWVPGTVEMVYILGKISESKNYDAIICLGAVIRGDTPHFEYVASQITRAVSQANFSGKIPVCFGIITADSVDQAIERAGVKAGNKGWQAALSAIEMANLKSNI